MSLTLTEEIAYLRMRLADATRRRDEAIREIGYVTGQLAVLTPVRDATGTENE